MHQLDPLLQSLDVELENASDGDDSEALMKQIKDRETMLMPLYLQVAHEFADLHDRSGRMKAKGVVRDVLDWKSSRAYLELVLSVDGCSSPKRSVWTSSVAR